MCGYCFVWYNYIALVLLPYDIGTPDAIKLSPNDFDINFAMIFFSEQLEELELLLNGIARLKELTLRTRDKLVSFGECMSTRVFAAYLNNIGVKAHQVSLLLLFSHRGLNNWQTRKQLEKHFLHGTREYYFSGYHRTCHASLFWFCRTLNFFYGI